MRIKMFIASMAGLTLLLLLANVAVKAHHAFAAEFDRNKPINLKGTITKVEWVNPHAWVHMDVKGADGVMNSWMVECGAPNALIRRGFTKDSLPIGVEIQVDGFQALNGSNRANGANITLPGGKQLFVGSSGTGAPYDPK